MGSELWAGAEVHPHRLNIKQPGAKDSSPGGPLQHCCLHSFQLAGIESPTSPPTIRMGSCICMVFGQGSFGNEFRRGRGRRSTLQEIHTIPESRKAGTNGPEDDHSSPPIYDNVNQSDGAEFVQVWKFHQVLLATEAQAAPGHLRLSLFFLCDILPPHLCLSSVPPSKAARGPGLIPSRTPGQLTSSWGLNVGAKPKQTATYTAAPRAVHLHSVTVDLTAPGLASQLMFASSVWLKFANKQQSFYRG
ncbi:hypothetical protein Q8A73_004179 [Channa argus]|nr:hypothetical protein Q8A73_004179 [Channa argus]